MAHNMVPGSARMAAKCVALATFLCGRRGTTPPCNSTMRARTCS